MCDQISRYHGPASLIHKINTKKFTREELKLTLFLVMPIQKKKNLSKQHTHEKLATNQA